MYMYIYVYVYIHVYVCMCTYLEVRSTTKTSSLRLTSAPTWTFQCSSCLGRYPSQKPFEKKTKQAGTILEGPYIHITYLCVCIYIHNIHLHAYIHIYVYVYVHVYVYVYVYVHICMVSSCSGYRRETSGRYTWALLGSV